MQDDPVGPFPLAAHWDAAPLGGFASCMPPRPPGASDLALEKITTVKENGFDPGRHTRDGVLLIPSGSRRGEDLGCDEIACGHVDLVVPSDRKVLRVERYASEALAQPIWHADPYVSIGWCQFTDVSWMTLRSGGVRITVGLKNWSEHRKRLLMVRVWVAQ